MGTCVSKCYPTSTAGSGSPLQPAAPLPQPAICCDAAIAAVHPLPNSGQFSFKGAMATSSSSSSTSSSFLNRERDSLLVEWDVVVLDPNNKKPPPPLMPPHRHSSRSTAKRARPLPTRPAPSSHHKKKTVVRSTEPHADAQARKKKKVAALDQRRMPSPQVRSSPLHEDDLTNPLISMDCFIFL
jgi:hypothetical protein